MKQVFIDQECSIHQQVVLNEKEAHHLFDVLRIKEKEVVRVVSSTSQVYLAYPQKKPFLYVFNEIETEQERQDITLCFALIKQDKFEWMLQKACELGVTRIVPFTSRNTIIKLDAQKEKKKLERWSQILLSACKQCNRNDLVELTPIQTIDTLSNFQSELNLVAYEKENNPSHHLAHFLSENPETVTICIGPEGGFETYEVEKLQQQHFHTCSLGNRILRAETAACYVLSCMEYQNYVKEEC